MELSIKPHEKNTLPVGGVVIRGSKPALWLREIQAMGLALDEVNTYALPGTKPNTIWGCIVIIQQHELPTAIGRNEYCQTLGNLLYIPENARLFPTLTSEETVQMFHSKQHFLHPEIGLVELSEPIEWLPLLAEPEITHHTVDKPAPAVFVPAEIKSYQVQSPPPEEVLQALQDGIESGKPFEDKPLNMVEKLRLKSYQLLFSEKGETAKSGAGNAKNQKSPSAFKQWLNKAMGKEPKWSQRMMEDFADLEERNKKAVDKLLELFNSDPEKALQFAIPLDEQGANRGSSNGALELTRRNLDWSLFGTGNRSGSGGTIDIGDQYQTLRAQYSATAEEFIRQDEHRKAAFVYMKLLNNHPMAAKTLEAGKLYLEAASIYLKYTKQPLKAAECYEHANCLQEAIELYKKHEQFEKVGDLYLRLNKRADANEYYEKVATVHTQTHAYIKAALIFREKMGTPERGQEILIKGWREGRDQFNCLNNYFRNISSETELLAAIRAVKHEDVTPANRTDFINALKYEFRQDNGLAEAVRDMAYEVISDEAESNPGIVSELQTFNTADQHLKKDIFRFKLSNRPSKKSQASSASEKQGK